MTILGVVMDAYLQNATREDIQACAADAEYRLFIIELDKAWVSHTINAYERHGYHVTYAEQYEGYKKDREVIKKKCADLEKEIDLLKAILRYTRGENDPLVM